jgi:hypothetical protein
VPLVAWEPYFCVLLQDEQTLTAYRSEELSVSVTLLDVKTCWKIFVFAYLKTVPRTWLSLTCVFDLEMFDLEMSGGELPLRVV